VAEAGISRKYHQAGIRGVTEISKVKPFKVTRWNPLAYATLEVTVQQYTRSNHSCFAFIATTQTDLDIASAPTMLGSPQLTLLPTVKALTEKVVQSD